jgi:hypothetical protein
LKKKLDKKRYGIQIIPQVTAESNDYNRWYDDFLNEISRKLMIPADALTMEHPSPWSYSAWALKMLPRSEMPPIDPSRDVEERIDVDDSGRRRSLNGAYVEKTDD